MAIRVLVVEDEAIVAESIQSKLIKFGYEVVGHTQTGEEAVELAGSKRPDVILMDIHLAGQMDGTQAADLIRGRYRIPVIYLTAYADEGTLNRAKLTGPFGYIVKPFRERDIYVAIEMAVVRSRLESDLAATNQELDSFSYSVSHDLRGPLITIEGFSTLLIEQYLSILPPEGQKYLQRIQESAQRMDALIADFLRLSRVSRAELDVREQNLSYLAQEILSRYADAEPDRKVCWTVEPGLTGFADAALIEIALSNLLQNAWKYTGRQELAEITFGKLDRAPTCVFFIRDNGAGFPMDKAAQLFVPLQRLHSSNEFPGTGIGLATVQRIIHRHGGKVWAEGEVDQGATFFFSLPEPSDTDFRITKP